MPSFTYRGRRLGYSVVGTGERAIVLTHGLLMDSRMYTRLASKLAAAGQRVVLVDMLGHGTSDQPHDMTAYSMPQFGRDIIALLDHLDLPDAVVGGASLGANVALEVAVAAPGRVRAAVLEMPVLENALPAAPRRSCRSRWRCGSASARWASSPASRARSRARTTSST